MAPKKPALFWKKVTVKKKRLFHEKWCEEKYHRIKDFGHEESVGFALSSGANAYFYVKGVSYKCVFYLNIKCLLTHFYQKKVVKKVTFVKKAIKTVTFIGQKKRHVCQKVIKKITLPRNGQQKESLFDKSGQKKGVTFVKKWL